MRVSFFRACTYLRACYIITCLLFNNTCVRALHYLQTPDDRSRPAADIGRSRTVEDRVSRDPNRLQPHKQIPVPDFPVNAHMIASSSSSSSMAVPSRSHPMMLGRKVQVKPISPMRPGGIDSSSSWYMHTQLVVVLMVQLASSS